MRSDACGMTYEQFIQSVNGLAGQISELHLQLAESQRSIVDQLIRAQSRDIAAIERSLDHLLDAAAHPVGLELFWRLCKYYWIIDPQATATYIFAYRDMWGDEKLESSLEEQQ
ncbi:hypothetical protein CGZ80_27030 [Rhodopirellula sp. MGV]|nr:hypothetical protein CGZ80_27030 [Rhodopirellula sp. MGV]